MQEKYYITHQYDERYDDFFSHENIECPIEDIQDENDYYHASFCVGQLKCWEELFFNNHEAMRKINGVKNYFLERHNYHEIIFDMYEAFDWEILIEKCDRIHKENS